MDALSSGTAFTFSGEDLNMVAAGLLYDMAELQRTERSRFGYKRAAKAIGRCPRR